MRKCSFLVTLALLPVTGVLLGGDAKSDADFKKLQGSWKFTAHHYGSKAATKDQLAKMKINFTDDKFSVTVDDKIVQAGTNKLDPSKKLAHVDSMVTEGDSKGITMLGIYEVKGDTLKVCFDPKGKQRPTSFTAKDGQFSATVQREKK